MDKSYISVLDQGDYKLCMLVVHGTNMVVHINIIRDVKGPVEGLTKLMFRCTDEAKKK